MSTNDENNNCKCLLPSQSWLVKNGYRELVKAMKEHPDKFKHIPQTKDPIYPDGDSFKILCKEIWMGYCAQGIVPPGIPHNPDVVYKKEWVSWSDWLGLSEEDFMEDVQE
jgi:hypothetical protein